LKEYLWNPDVTPTLDLKTGFNDFPIPPLINLGNVGFDWQYGLSTPELGLGLRVDPGDQLKLYGHGLTGAMVSGSATSASFGAWMVASVDPRLAVFTATTSGFLPGSLLLDGFSLTSAFTRSNEIVYTEAIAGHVGLVAGAIPEPATGALLVYSLSILCMAGRGWLHNRRQRL
jgi:hypothetical protein